MKSFAANGISSCTYVDDLDEAQKTTHRKPDRAATQSQELQNRQHMVGDLLNSVRRILLNFLVLKNNIAYCHLPPSETLAANLPIRYTEKLTFRCLK